MLAQAELHQTGYCMRPGPKLWCPISYFSGDHISPGALLEQFLEAQLQTVRLIARAHSHAMPLYRDPLAPQDHVICLWDLIITTARTLFSKRRDLHKRLHKDQAANRDRPGQWYCCESAGRVAHVVGHCKPTRT
jgi:hypothetical protein